VNTAQRNFKITLKGEVGIRGYGKCESAVYTTRDRVKPIVVKLSYSTMKTSFFDKINEAMWGDLVAQVWPVSDSKMFIADCIPCRT
jgi:hypothetical protein